MSSNTERTLKLLKSRGMKAGIVERYIAQVWVKNGQRGIRKDLFGIIDIIALDPSRGVIGVQSAGQDFSGHDRKILTEKRQDAIDWLSTPGTSLELIAWRKIKKERGKSTEIWAPRIKIYTLADFKDFDPLGFSK